MQLTESEQLLTVLKQLLTKLATRTLGKTTRTVQTTDNSTGVANRKHPISRKPAQTKVYATSVGKNAHRNATSSFFSCSKLVAFDLVISLPAAQRNVDYNSSDLLPDPGG